MYNPAITYQSHREGLPGMKNKMWVASYHSYLDTANVSRSLGEFATREDAEVAVRDFCDRNMIDHYIVSVGGEQDVVWMLT